MEDLGCKIYDIETLMTKEFTSDDYDEIVNDTPSLSYSLHLRMFEIIGDKRSPQEIIEMCKTDPQWMYKTFWNKQQREQFEQELVRVANNMFGYDDDEAHSYANWWIFINGLTRNDYESDELQHSKNP